MWYIYKIGTSEEKTTSENWDAEEKTTSENWDVRRKDYVRRKDFDNGRMGRQKKGRRQWDVRRKDVDREVGRQKKRLRQWEDGTSEEILIFFFAHFNVLIYCNKHFKVLRVVQILSPRHLFKGYLY